METHSLHILIPQCLHFFMIYCLKITLPFNFTIISFTAKCSEGPYNFEKFVIRISNKSHIFHRLWGAETKVCDNILSVPSFVCRKDGKAFPVLSSSPPVCLELYVPTVMSEPKTQTFPLLSSHVGENVLRQNFLGTGHSSDSSPQPVK